MADLPFGLEPPKNLEELRALARTKALTSNRKQYILKAKVEGWLVTEFRPLETDQVLEEIDP